MTLEQRIEALEKAVKALTDGDLPATKDQTYINDALINDGLVTATDVGGCGLNDIQMQELSKMMRSVSAEAIKNAQRPGGVLYKNGSGEASAEWGVRTHPANGQLAGFNLVRQGLFHQAD